MAEPWEPYACKFPRGGVAGTCSVMDIVHHVTHTPAALRIIDDRKISRGLIYDECLLNDTRTTVVWLSPNEWYHGSRYGNVEFTYDFAEIAKGRKIYWVEAHTKYSPHACRFLITSDSVKHLPVRAYDPVKDEGPLRLVDGTWYWNFAFTGEFMLQDTLWLDECKRISFIRHHHTYCAIGGCNDRGKDGAGAAGRVVAQILSRNITAIDGALIVTEPKKALSTGVDLGLSRIQLALGAASGNLRGPLKSDDSVDACLRAALLQYAQGDLDGAKATASLIGSDDIFRQRLSQIVLDHFELKSMALDE